jgi:hypothetical protein
MGSRHFPKTFYGGGITGPAFGSCGRDGSVTTGAGCSTVPGEVLYCVTGGFTGGAVVCTVTDVVLCCVTTGPVVCTLPDDELYWSAALPWGGVQHPLSKALAHTIVVMSKAIFMPIKLEALASVGNGVKAPTVPAGDGAALSGSPNHSENYRPKSAPRSAGPPASTSDGQ